MNRITIVQAIISKLKAKSYLEIGVSLGHAFLSIDAQMKIAVDPKNLIKNHPITLKKDDWILEIKKLYRFFLQLAGKEDARFFEMTSDDFFETQKSLLQERQIDVAFVDGLHSYGQAFRDVENCLQYLSPHGVIVLHDCNPISAEMETPAESFAQAEALNSKDWNKLWCGDVWKAMVRLRSLHRDLNVFVLDCDMGIGIVTRGTPEIPLDYSLSDIDRLNYKDLEQMRARLLNLKSPKAFSSFLQSLPSK
jgi:hypothetical protein